MSATARTALIAPAVARHLPRPTGAVQPALDEVRRLLPGLLLCAAVTAAATALQAVETRLLGRAWLEALVLAILVGTAVRTAWTGPALVTRHRVRRQDAAGGRGGSARRLGERAHGLLRRVVPHVALAPAASVADWFTVISMAALGLGTDLRTVARADGRVTAAVTGSLLVLGAISLGLIRPLGVA